MERLLEHEVFAASIGEPVNLVRLNKIGITGKKGSGSYADCDEFVICHTGFYTDPEYAGLFKITDSIRERWDKNNIDYRIYLYLKDFRIVGGHIFKYRSMNWSSPARPAGYEVEPTQQEIRIASRILQYLAEKKP